METMGLEQPPLRWRRHRAQRPTLTNITTDETDETTPLKKLLRLAAESGLWANAGGRFGDLSDARVWLAGSPRMRAAAYTTVIEPPTISLAQDLLLPAQAMPFEDRISVYADTAVTWALTPLFKCFKVIEIMSEIQFSTLCSHVMVQSMLQMFILFTFVAARARLHSVGLIHRTWSPLVPARYNDKSK